MEMQKIPFPDNFFDVVISINCAHNLEQRMYDSNKGNEQSMQNN